MTTKELIRQEIEKRVKELDEQIVDIYDSKAVLRKDELQRLLSFITTLEEPVSEDLEEAAEESWIYYEYRDSGHLYSSVYKDAFKAGAEWQSMKEQDTIKTAEDHAFLAGANWQKEQMMENAVEGEVVKDISNKLAVTAKNVNIDGFKFGDKVRVIIVKEG